MTQSKEMPEIKPCPCCRNKAELRTKHPDYFGAGDWTKPTFKIKCTVCPITTGWVRDEAKLIIGWNTRATPPQSPNRAVLDALIGAREYVNMKYVETGSATTGRFLGVIDQAIAASTQADEVKVIPDNTITLKWYDSNHTGTDTHAGYWIDLDGSLVLAPEWLSKKIQEHLKRQKGR